MPNIRQLFPSAYLRGAELEVDECQVMIVNVAPELVTNSKGETDEKLVLTFDRPVGSGHARKLVANKTNAHAIAEVLGSDETDDWIQRKITLIRESYAGQPVVRIKH